MTSKTNYTNIGNSALLDPRHLWDKTNALIIARAQGQYIDAMRKLDDLRTTYRRAVKANPVAAAIRKTYSAEMTHQQIDKEAFRLASTYKLSYGVACRLFSAINADQTSYSSALSKLEADIQTAEQHALACAKHLIDLI